jgi:hypothetical protein
MEIETTVYRKTKYSRDDIQEMDSRIQFVRSQKK